jgi:predicted negative regulator of RcsB-dependent stress response
MRRSSRPMGTRSIKDKNSSKWTSGEGIAIAVVVIIAIVVVVAFGYWGN